MANCGGGILDTDTGLVDAILMASGFSRRFGAQNKLLAPFLGKPLLVHSLHLLTSSGLFNQIFLAAADADVLSLARPYPVRVLPNHHPECGMRESIRLGALASSADYLLFVPGDQPLLDCETLRRILAARRPRGIVQPYFENRPGNPVLFSATYRGELATLAPGQHARSLMEKHAAQVLRLPLPSAAPLLDVDLPEDLAKLEAMAGH